MSFTLQQIPHLSAGYEAITEANRLALISAINELYSIASAAGGHGAQLILDLFDRDGCVGSASYALDTENYTGGSEIVVGRRPAADTAKGDQDVSIAFGTYGGIRQRVTMTGDVTLDAAAFLDGLPKTIYIAVPSDGTPQIYEDADLPNLVYLYSMTWNGFTLSSFKEIGHILPGFSLVQDLAKAIETERVYDGRTDFLAETESRSTIVLGGNGVMNEIDLNLSRKVLGGFLAFEGGRDGFFSPVDDGDTVELEIWDDQDRRWNLEDIEVDCSATPTRVFFKADPALGDDLFATGVREFRVVKVSAGAGVTSARGFSWGLYTQAVIGNTIAKDTDSVDGI